MTMFTNISLSGIETVGITLNNAKQLMSSSSNPILALEKNAPKTLAVIDTFQDIDWEVELVDTGGMHDPAQPEEINVKQKGTFLVHFQLCFENVANTTYTAQAVKDGSPISLPITVSSNPNTAVILQGTFIAGLEEPDVYKIQWKASKIADLLIGETKFDMVMLNPKP